jgi:hypothetical protein
MMIITFSEFTFATRTEFSAKEVAIQLNASVNTNPKGLKISWEKKIQALTYVISRKTIDSQDWGTAIANLDSSTTEFVDVTAAEGESYEYELMCYSEGYSRQKINGKDSLLDLNFLGFGYILAGYNTKPIHTFGKCLILVDETMADNLSPEITTLEEDLITEGWGVLRRAVPRAEKFNGDNVKAVKAIIKAEYTKDNSISSIFIIGRVPVPYSGNLNPDGHPDHQGAWPADVYYTCLKENEFNDFSTNTTSATREQNKNIPKDGKFDISTLNLNNPFAIMGRVDFYDMPAFSKSETELLRNYLNKDHKYRTGQLSLSYKGIVDDNFGGYGELFAQNGWRNFPSLVGAKNVTASDFFTTLGTDNTLFSYGCGGGTFTSAGGIGSTPDFAANKVNGIFTLLFGSYFGDWDSQNNFLRAAIASEPNALTCGWAARPSWFMHHMGLGYPIGYSWKISQLNYTLYKPLAYYSGTTPTIYHVGMRGVHVALMGDPTLTMFSEYINPAKSISASQKTDLTKNITWESSDTPGELFYNVYKSTKREGPYTLIGEMIKGNSFNDTITYEGRVYYMVRASKLITNYSGSSYQLSRGIYTTIMVTDVCESAESYFKITPNPAKDNINLDFNLNDLNEIKIELLSLEGEIMSTLFDGKLSQGEQKLSYSINNLNLSSGTYFIRIKSNEINKLNKLVIIK